MGEVFGALLTVVLGLGGFVGVLLLIYTATNALPKRFRERGQIAVFLGPALILLVLGLAIPAVRSVWISLHSDTKGFPFGGLANYKTIFTEKNGQTAVINSVLWVVVGGTLSTLIGLTIARYADGLKGERILKSLIFIPITLSLAGAGIIWKFVYDGPPFNYGLLNAVTKTIPGWPKGLGGDGQRLWLLEHGAYMNTILLVVILIWVQTAFATIILSAAIKGVPEALGEAAQVDGANSRQVFYKITLPYIRPALLTVISLGAIGALKAFDIVQATTGGNFGTSTIANESFTTFFTQNRDGLGSALAVVLFILVIPVVILNQRGQKLAAEVGP